MPNFLTWGMENDKFGAYVQQQPTRHAYNVETNQFVKTVLDPVTNFFDTQKIGEMAGKAKGSKEFWQNLSDIAPKQEALYANSRDIATEPISKAAAPAQGLNLSNKQTFQV